MILGRSMVGRVLDWTLMYGPNMLEKMMLALKDQEKVWVKTLL